MEDWVPKQAVAGCCENPRAERDMSGRKDPGKGKEDASKPVPWFLTGRKNNTLTRRSRKLMVKARGRRGCRLLRRLRQYY